MIRALRNAMGAEAASESTLAPWLELIARRGPTPARGPLAFDLLVPHPGAPHRMGLTVFGHGDDSDVRRAVRRASLGDECDEWLDGIDRAGVEWNAGVYLDAGVPRVKLYLTGDIESIASQWPTELEERGSPMSLGVDLLPSGPGRHRVYLESTDPSVSRLCRSWSFADPVPWEDGSEGLAHRLLTARGRCGSPGAKRTRNWIYAPHAPISALRKALPPDHQEALDALTQRDLPSGLEWAPVALESDAYGDGRSEIDWLVTVRRAE